MQRTRTTTRTRRIALVVLVAAGLGFAAWGLDPLQGVPGAARLLLNALPVWLLFAALLGLTRRLGLAALATLGVVALFHAANAIKLHQLEIPLLPSDAHALEQIVQSQELFARYLGFSPAWLLVLLLPLAWAWFERPMQLGIAARIGLLAVAIAGAWTAAAGAAPWPWLYARLAPPLQAWTPLRSAREHGSIAFFTRMLALQGRSLPAPDQARLDALRERLPPPHPPLARERLPDLVVVQSEAWFDPARVRGLDQVEWLPEFSRLRAMHAHGELDVPAYGGLTTRTEFEVLTGIPMQAFPDVQYPYQTLIAAPLPALPSRLREAGYRTIAVHPYDPRFYRRHRVMPMLGFERFHGGDEFEASDRHGFYISDEALRRRVEDLADRDGAQFVFAITMENHGPWNPGRELPAEALAAIEVPVSLAPETADELRRYLHHAMRADAMLGALARWVETRDEPTVLLFYGDHLPGLHDVFDQLGFVDDTHATRQPVPWILVCSPGTCDASGAHRLAAYELGAALMGVVGLPLDPHFHALHWTMSSLPADERIVFDIELGRERIRERAEQVEATAPEPGEVAVVEAWGPASVESDPERRRELPALWVRAREPLPRGLQLVLDGRRVRTHVDGEHVLVGVLERSERDDWLLAPGRLGLQLYDGAQDRIQPIGELEVRPEAVRAKLGWWRRAASLCPVRAWGPDRTSLREPANPQPDGALGLWIQTDCAPTRVEIALGDHRLPAVAEPGLTTASVPPALLQAASSLAIALVDPETGERLDVGELTVEP